MSQDFVFLCPPDCAQEETRSVNNLKFHLENALAEIAQKDFAAAEWSVLRACEAFPVRRRAPPSVALSSATKTLLMLVRRFNLSECAPASQIDFSN